MAALADRDAARSVQVDGIDRLHGPAGGLQQAVDLGARLLLRRAHPPLP